MQLKISQEAFHSELALAMGAVENKATLPVANLVHLHAVDGNLIVTSTNLNFSIRSKIQAEVDEKGILILPADSLNSWLSKAQNGDVSLKTGKRATLRAGRSVANINICDKASFPDFPKLAPPVAEVPAEVLAEMLSSIAFVIPAFDDARFQFAVAKLEFKGSSITAVATNGNRMAIYETSIPGLENASIDFCVPRKAVLEISRIAARAKDAKVKIFADKQNMFFGLGNRLIHSRMMAGNFPQWKKAIQPGGHIATFATSELSDALGRIVALSDSESRKAVARLSSNGLALSSSSNSGDGEEVIDVTYSGPEIAIGLNAQYLQDGLRAIHTEKACLRVVSGKAPLELTAEDPEPQYRYIFAPMDV